MNNFSRAISTSQAVQIAASIIHEANPRGLQCPDRVELAAKAESDRGDYLSITVKRGWAIECSLYINIRSSYGDTVRDREGSDWVVCSPTVEVNWGSSGKDISKAQACMALYQEVINLGAEIEARLSEEYIAQMVQTKQEREDRAAAQAKMKETKKVAGLISEHIKHLRVNGERSVTIKDEDYPPVGSFKVGLNDKSYSVVGDGSELTITRVA